MVELPRGPVADAVSGPDRSAEESRRLGPDAGAEHEEGSRRATESRQYRTMKRMRGRIVTGDDESPAWVMSAGSEDLLSGRGRHQGPGRE
jgi:hypothetical protein